MRNVPSPRLCVTDGPPETDPPNTGNSGPKGRICTITWSDDWPLPETTFPVTVAALLSFTTGAFWGFVLAVVAIIAAIIGMIAAASPSVRGGLMSTMSLIAGGIALVAAAIKALMWLF